MQFAQVLYTGILIQILIQISYGQGNNLLEAYAHSHVSLSIVRRKKEGVEKRLPSITQSHTHVPFPRQWPVLSPEG